ncbi:MAG: hypothetical protein PUC59_06670 [Firmicutes bacterium]|nr:hypothetical protein [Bacillota bacterium]
METHSARRNEAAAGRCTAGGTGGAQAKICFGGRMKGRISVNKKLYTKNYEVRRISLPNGSVREEVIYKGDYYCPQWTPRQKRAVKTGGALLTACSVALFVLVGLLNTAGSRQYYVLLPFLATSFPIAFNIFAIFRLLASSDRMTIDVFHNSFLRLRRSSVTAFLVAAAGIIGDVIFLILNPANYATDELMFLFGVFGIFADNLALFLIFRRIPYTAVPNSSAAANECSGAKECK